MIDRTIARRYAQAFFGIAREQGKIEQFEQELKLVVEMLAAHPKFEQVMSHQLIEPDKKKELINNVFAGRLSQESINFLRLIADKRRERYLKQIAAEYVALADEARDVLAATVITAKELSDSHYRSIQEKLSRMTGKNIRLQTQLDPDIIAGVVVRIGDRVFDGSIANRLANLKEHLTKVNFSKDRGEEVNEH